jgi:hypothetical protein
MRENVVDASVEIRLDGKDFILRYRALAFIEYAANCDGDLLNDVRALGSQLAGIEELAKSGDAKFGPLFGKVRDILWAGLVDAQPKLTRADVARLFGLRDFQPTVQKIMEALMGGLPEASEVRPTRPAPINRGRSSRLANGVASGQPSATPAASDTANSAV